MLTLQLSLHPFGTARAPSTSIIDVGLVIPLLHLSRAAHRLGISPLFRLRFGDFPLFRFLFGDVVPYFGAMLSLLFCSFYSLVLGPSLIRSNLLQLM